MEYPHEKEKSTLPEKIVWLLFCLTALQLVFFKSYVNIIPGVKADSFAGSLCALTLALSLLVAHKNVVTVRLPEVLVSLALIVLAGASALTSGTPWSSLVLAFVLLATGLGGFWTGRILLISQSRQRSFVWLCYSALIGMSILGLWSHYFHGKINYFIDDEHLVVNMIILLSFSPITLMSWRKPYAAVLGMSGLALGYALLYLCGVTAADSGVLIPIAMLTVALLTVGLSSRSIVALVFVLLIGAAVTTHFVSYMSTKTHSDKAYQAERMEYYPFSWHIAKQHPVLGVGLRTPKDEFLENYEIRNPRYTKDKFSVSVSKLKIFQNTFLTLMVGLGLPFMALYSFALLTFYWRLTRAAMGSVPRDIVIPPLALLIPLTGSLMHLLVMDMLLMPNIAWFFHLLLGLAPAAVPVEVLQRAPVRRSLLRPAAASIVAIALGIFIGTHPALSPDRLPSRSEILAYAHKLPVIGPLFLDESPRRAEAETGFGTLVVNLPEGSGIPAKWAILCVLDNSKLPAQPEDHWRAGRLKAAVALIQALGESMPADSKIGVRAFSEAGPMRRHDAEMRLHVSRVLHNWADTPFGDITFNVDATPLMRGANPCAAIKYALRWDFETVGAGLARRILLISDGKTECNSRSVLEAINSARRGSRRVHLDVIAVGMKDSISGSYREAVQESRGVFMEVSGPHEIGFIIRQYVDILAKFEQQPLVARSEGREYEVLPNSQTSLPPGQYEIIIPHVHDSVASDRRPLAAAVQPGQTTVVDLPTIDAGSPDRK